MTAERALEILSAYGADPARWPQDERAPCLALIARDPSLARARRDAAVLDAALGGWAAGPIAVTPAATEAAVARALAAIETVPARALPVRAWHPIAGLALAASVAAAVFFGAPRNTHTPTPAAVATVAAVRPADSEAFRQVFTPTPEEEEVL